MAPGQELTYDYSYEVGSVVTERGEKVMHCHCGAPTCRGRLL
jgi:SET domain-containing protein